ncbi:MAG: ATP-binding protein [Candidatus Hydrothermarchaeales archaeon]
MKEKARQLREYKEQLEEKVKERTEELEASNRELFLLQEINNAVNTRMDLDEILQIIIEGMTTVFNYYSSGIYLLSDDEKYLVIRNYSLDAGMIKKIEKVTGMSIRGYEIPLYEGSIFRRAIENREPIITEDIVMVLENHTNKEHLKALAKVIAKIIGLKSGVGVPLVAGDKLVGMLGVTSKDAMLSNRDTERLMRFADQAGLAIEKAKLYEELKEYSEHLEGMVEERTKELEDAQQQLIQSEKLASIGQLAAGIAHEINNPLANILMYAHLLKRDIQEKKPNIEDVDVIIEQTEITSKIVQDLLEFSRQEKSEMSLISINDLICKALDILENQLVVDGIDVVKRLRPDIPDVLGDANKLSRAFFNLVMNAYQAMPDGGKLILSTTEEDSFVKITISDTGIGIPREHLSKIFDPFFTTKPVGGGTGLGLSVVHGIIEEHNGTIMVKSRVGSGTTFTIKLPKGEESDKKDISG